MGGKRGEAAPELAGEDAWAIFKTGAMKLTGRRFFCLIDPDKSTNVNNYARPHSFATPN
jgi:hypothetical protein